MLNTFFIVVRTDSMRSTLLVKCTLQYNYKHNVVLWNLLELTLELTHLASLKLYTH